MWVQRGEGYLQMWPILLVLTTLTVSVAGEELCYKLSPYRVRIDWAQGRCVQYGGHLMRVRNEEDVATVKNVTGDRVSDNAVIIDGYYNQGVWRYYDGTTITFTDKWLSMNFHSTKKWIVMEPNAGYWVYTNVQLQFRHYICEAPKVIGISTNGSCYQPAPELQNANKTENATHVVYECHPGYELPDMNTSKTLECGCAALTSIEPCLPISKETCLVETFGPVYKPYLLRQFCRHSNASLPQVFNQRDNEALQQKLIEKGINAYCLLDIHSYGDNNFVVGTDQLPINYTNFRMAPKLDNKYRFVSTSPYGLWDAIDVDRVDMWPLCEVEKDQVEGGCSTGRPTFPHSTIASQNETHVTYSCDTNYAFPDGTSQKTVKCGCENAMFVHGCQLVKRDICLQPVRILLNVNNAEEFCNTAGGTLAKIINNEEMNAVQPALFTKELWLSGKKHDGVWYWGDGSKMAGHYLPWHPDHPFGDPPPDVRAVTLYSAGTFLQRDDLQSSRYFVCEIEPAVTCPATIPAVPHSSATTNGTHITYTCDNYYTFDNGSPNKIVRCNCGELTKLAGCHMAVDELCYKLAPFRTKIDRAQGQCVQGGGHLMRVRSEEDVWRVRNITSGVVTETVIIDGLYNGGQWLYYDGTQITWSNWQPNVRWHYTRRWIVMDRLNLWYNQNVGEFRRFICEAPKVIGISTTDSCYQPAPFMENANKTENATHVVYECHPGYELPDRNTSKTLECDCAGLTNIEPCLPIKATDICLVSSLGFRYKPHLTKKHCYHSNASLPKVLNKRDNDILQQKLTKEGFTYCLLDIYSTGVFDFTVGIDEASIYYSNFAGHPTWHPDYRYVKIAADTGIWTSLSQHTKNLNQICEVDKEQVEGGCSTGRPTFTHSTITSQNETHVTYSCDTDYAFPDGTSQKTIECGCENAMLVHGCHVFKRDTCIQSVRIMLNLTNAEEFCNTAGGTLAKIISAEEMDEVQPSKHDFWTSGKIYDGQFYWGDGSRFVYSPWPNGYPSGAGSAIVINPAHNFIITGKVKYSKYFVCEKEPTATCPATIPAVPHSSATTNGTHITYTCNNYYTFDDGSPNKIVRCNCGEITKLAGCHKTSRNVCFANTPLKDTAPAAKAYCESFGTSQAKVLNGEEHSRLSSLLFPFATDGWLDGRFNRTEGIWRWTNGKYLLYENWLDATPDFTSSWDYDYVHLRSDHKFHNDIKPEHSSTIYCEKEYDPSLPCSDDPPGIAHGTVSATNTTHVTYRCDENYAFTDGEPERTFLCGCEVLGNVDPCLPSGRDVYYFIAAPDTTHSLGSFLCEANLGGLPRTYNYEEHKALQSLIVGGHHAHLEGYRSSSTLNWMLSENERIVWNLFGKSNPHPPNDRHNHLAIDNYRDIWVYIWEKSRRQLICEKVRNLAVTCDTEEPPTMNGATFTHNGTHVTYTCNDKHAFLDGDLSKVYPCDVASLAPLNPCHMNIQRDVCLVYVRTTARLSAATEYCSRMNGTIIKIMNAQEQQRAADLVDAKIWIEGSKYESGNWAWRYNDETMMVYDNIRHRMDENDGQQYLYMDTDKDWFNDNGNKYVFFVCEKEADTSVTCTSPPPTMPYADMTYNTTHVNYTCHPGAAFSNGDLTKVYTCSCASFEVNQACIQNTREVCFAPTKVRRHFKQQVATCRHFNLTLAKIVNQNELTTAVSMLNGLGDNKLYLGASALELLGMYIYTDGTPFIPIRWTNGWTPHRSDQILAVHIDTTGYMKELTIYNRIHGLCEVEGAYTCEDAPEVENADRNVTATEVIYTCKPHHSFCDGETQKTYSCLCAQTAVMESCKPDSRPVCIANAVTRSTYYPTARSICQARNGELPRLTNDADVARFQQLGLRNVFVDGDNINPESVFKYSDGEVIRCTKKNSEGPILAEPNGQNVLYILNLEQQYQRSSINDRKKGLCEVPKDESCTQTPPDVPHATFVSNSTHVTYRCEKGYKFMNDLTEKVYPCDCVNTATIDPCLGPRRLCFAQSEFKLNQQGSESFCNKSRAHLAKIESGEEVDLMIVAMRTPCFISGNDRKRAADYRWHDDTPIEYSYWGDSNRDPEKDAIILNRNKYMYHRYSYEPHYFLCEKELPKASCAVPEQQRSAQNFATEAECEDNNYCWQVPTSGSVPSCFDPIIPAGMPTNEELCGVPPSIAHGSCVNINDVITCTCDSDAQYSDGTTEKIYSCDCASLAVIQFCALRQRAELCLVETSLKRPYRESQSYCEEHGGRLPIIYSLTEQDRLRDMSVGATLWLDGSDEKEEHIWVFNNTGDMAVYQNHEDTTGNTSRNNLIFNRETAKWKDVPADEIHGFVCEAAPDSDCISSAPSVDNADRTLTASTVTYRCKDGYKFFDKTQEKTYNCQCYALLSLLHCTAVVKSLVVSSYPTTYGDGDDTCVHLGGTLVQVNDEPTTTSTLQILDKWKVSSAWISAKSTLDFSFAGVECLTINTEGEWGDTTCTQKHHFVCELGNKAERLPWNVKSRLTGWKYNSLLWGVPDELFPAPSKRSIIYFTPGTSQTWSAAKDTCGDLGGNLARATSNDEARMLAAFSNRFQNVWLNGDDSSGGMRWPSGKLVYAPTVVTLTTDDTDSLQCLQADGLTWTDADCNTQQPFICEKKIGADWPDTNYCTWKEELTQTWADAQATCQQHDADLAWVDNAWDLANLVNDSDDSLNNCSSLLWLGAKELTGVWKRPSGDSHVLISWSQWADDGQDTAQLGCMVYDCQSRRTREHSCDATDVTVFFCRRSGVQTPSKMTLRNKELACDSGYGFSDGSRKIVLNSTIDCKTMTSTVDPGDQYGTCYPTNNFMMKHLGNYKTEDEYALTDESHETCTDLVKIWSKGPRIANFRKVWKGASVNITIITDFDNLLTTKGKKKIAVRVDVSNDSPWVEDTYGRSRKLTRCTELSVVTYRCVCSNDDEPCSVFVSVTVRDPSVLTNVGSLKLCHIAMTPIS